MKVVLVVTSLNFNWSDHDSLDIYHGRCESEAKLEIKFNNTSSIY